MNEKNLLKIDLKTVSLRNEALEQFMLEVMSFIKERSKKIKNQHTSRRHPLSLTAPREPMRQ